MNISRLFLILITCFCFSCNFKKTKDDSQICNSVESKRLYDVKIMNLKGNVFEHYNLYKKYTYYILTTEGNTYALDIKTSPAGGLDKKYLVTGVKNNIEKDKTGQFE